MALATARENGAVAIPELMFKDLRSVGTNINVAHG